MSPKTSRTLPFGLSLLLLVGCAGESSPHPTLPGDATEDTRLGIGDVFDVRVYGEEDLSGSYRVAQDGSIDFPLVGRLGVEGMVPTDLADRLTRELREGDLLRNPQVSIFVREYNSKQVSVLGAVAHPGAVPMTPGLTVVHAIGLAGGFNSLANRNGVVVTRNIDDELTRYVVRAQEISRGREDDFPLRAGDLIFVPERAF